MKNLGIALLVIIIIVLVGGGAYYFFKQAPTAPAPTDTMATTTAMDTGTATTTAPEDTGSEVIGQSVQGNDITAYHYGTGNTEILFVGGIGGGYESNTVQVAYSLMDYLDENPSAIPANEKVTVIPVLNPDGLKKVVGTTDASFSQSDVPALADTIPGRFNANNVDLDRNFDCDWQAQGVWQSKTVSGGSAAFSEPESQAIEAYVKAHNPTAAVVWYSAAGGVYAASCDSAPSSDTTAITNLYAKAAGYPAHQSFDLYATTGDLANWLAKVGVASISVILTNHTDTEWSKNQAGVDALLAHYAK